MGVVCIKSTSVESEITLYDKLEICFGGSRWAMIMRSVLEVIEDQDLTADSYNMLQGVTSRTVFPACSSIQRDISGIMMPGHTRCITKKVKSSALRSLCQ